MFVVTLCASDSNKAIPTLTITVIQRHHLSMIITEKTTLLIKSIISQALLIIHHSSSMGNLINSTGEHPFKVNSNLHRTSTEMVSLTRKKWQFTIITCKTTCNSRSMTEHLLRANSLRFSQADTNHSQDRPLLLSEYTLRLK